MGRNRKDATPPAVTDFAYTFRLSRKGKASCDWVSQSFTPITGHPNDTLQQHGWDHLIYPKDRPLLKERPAVLLSGRGDVREFRIITADGHLKWVRDYAQPVRAEPGGDVLVFASVQDVTAGKRAEGEMRRIASIVENSQDAIIDITLDGVIVNWNRSAERIYGYSSQEMKGRTASLLVPAEQTDETAGILATVHREGSVDRLETRRIRKDGTIVSVALTAGPVHDETGQLIGASIISRDISELKRAESALQENATKTAAILGTMVDGVITIDERGIIDSFNTAAERLFGYAPLEVVGRNVKMLMPEPYHGEHDGYLRNYLRTGKAKIIGIGREVVGRRKNGSTFPMDLAVSEVFLGPRRLFTGIVRDLTDRKQLERQILGISDREQQRIGQDLHDGLGQQLAGIGFLSKSLEQRLARKNAPESKDAREIAELVSEAIAQARGMAHGLNPVDMSATGLMSALRELVSTVQRTFRIACTLTCEEPVLLNDGAVATHLYRIIQEAVNNAIKHGQAHHISVVVARAGDTITVSVRDDGVGFPDALPENKGIGLQTMRYRAALIGATLSILRVQTGGTRVDCSLKDGEPKSPDSKYGKDPDKAAITPKRVRRR
jgi:PAS domain S-box-containing protein